jgi:hypothetical protein
MFICIIFQVILQHCQGKQKYFYFYIYNILIYKMIFFFFGRTAV